MSKSAIQLAERMEALTKNFPSLYKNTGEADSALPAVPDSSKVVIDPKQRRHLVVKLLEERRTFLNELMAQRTQP